MSTPGATAGGPPRDPIDDDAIVRACLERARTLGFLGAGSLEPVMEHGRAVVAAVRTVQPSPELVIDLGSGGGVPGLAVVAGLPGCQVVLVERRARRADALVLAVHELGAADRVEVVTGDAYEVAWSDRRGRADVVVARGFGPPSVVAEYGAPLLRTGGWLLVTDRVGRGRWPAASLAEIGLAAAHRWEAGWPIEGLRCVGPVPDGLPRRGDLPRRHPLFE